MSLLKKYDELIKQSIRNQHMLPDCPYYDEYYFKGLDYEIKVRGLTKKFGQLEYKVLANGSRNALAPRYI